MNKLFWLGVLVFVVMPATAESVSSVSFNPSRLGNYDYLKVSGPAKLPGGLRTSELNINSPGVVTLQNNTTAAIFNVESISGNNMGTEFRFPNAIMHSGSAVSGTFGYSASSKAAPSAGLLSLDMRGGTLDFSSNSTIDSYLNELSLNYNLYQYAQTLHATNVEVRMPEDDGMSDDKVTLINAAMEASASTPGFTLGTTDILRPNQVKYKETASSTSTFYSSIDLTKNNCQLRWVKRKLSDQDNKFAYVLALDNCDVTCVPTSQNMTVTRDCSDEIILGNAGYLNSGWYGTASTVVRFISTCEPNGGQYQATEPTMVYIKADGTTTENPAEANWDKSGCYAYAWEYQGQEFLDQPHWHEAACIGNHDNDCDRVIPLAGMVWLSEGYWENRDTCTSSRMGQTATRWMPNDSAWNVIDHHTQIKQTLWCHKYSCKLIRQTYKCQQITVN